MAEFNEIMHTRERMCQEICVTHKQYDECPMNGKNNGKNINCMSFFRHYPEEAEILIMKWAKEHPVMTNKQKMMEIIAEAFGEDLAIHLIGHRHKCEGIACGDNSCESCTYSKFWDKEYQPPKDAADE